MKAVALTIVGLLCLGTINAQQKIEKHINFSGKESITLEIQIADSITVHTWNRNEVYINASVNINHNKNNDAYLITFNDAGKNVVVSAKFRENYFQGKCNCCDTSNIYWEIYVPDKTTFNLESINADITIDGQTAGMKVKSISGYIDLAVPANRDADVDLSTISATIYTNHDLKPEKMHTGVPVKIAEKLNNGGATIRLETISGDIFLRKSIDQ